MKTFAFKDRKIKDKISFPILRNTASSLYNTSAQHKDIRSILKRNNIQTLLNYKALIFSYLF